MTPAALAPAVEPIFRALRARVVAAFDRPEVSARRKEDRSVVTDLDLELEDLLAPALLGLDASFGLVSEERGRLREGNPTWVLDPLDGSFNFSRRLPLFACQAALLAEDGPLFAAIYEPLRDDFAWAARGAGAWREGRRLRVSGRAPEEALVLMDLDERGLFQDDPSLAARLRRAVRKVRSLGSIGLHLRDAAAGVADGVLGGRGRPQPLHDLAPGVLLLREAGGVATDAEGADALARRETLVAGTPEVHVALRRLLRPPGG